MHHILAMLLILCGLPVAYSAEATRLAGSPHMVELRNELLTVRIDLSRGARVASFIYSGFDGQDVVYEYASGNGGLCKDLWTVQGWPGEFNQRLYEAEIVSAGPEEAIVRTWTVSTGDFKNRINQSLSELLVEKTYTLRRSDRALHVELAITNQGSSGKRPAYWSQSALDFDGERKHNQYWRPTRHGVDMISREVSSEYGYWYVAIPRTGWNGVTNPKVKRGMMFLMDYNSLQQLYDNCEANTIEWMYNDTAIPAGKTWRTAITLIPTEGYAAYRHGDADIVADFQVDSTPSGLRIDHTISASSKLLTEVQVQTHVFGATGDWQVDGPAIRAERLGFSPLRESILVKGTGSLPCVVRVTVTGTAEDGTAKTIVYEDYHGGAAGRNLNLELLEPHHEFTAPPKQAQYLKPDTIELAHNERPRILFIRGLWAKFQGVDEALQLLGDVEVVDGWMKKSALGETLGNFPSSYEDLLSFNTIILANVSGDMLADVGQEMLADYLKAGGRVLLLSGDRTYGQAHFTNPRFLELLPVTFKTGGDYGRLSAPSPLKPVAGHAITEGLAFPPEAVVLYSHQLANLNTAVPLLQLADGTPAALSTPPGKPRVVLITTLPFGEAAPGQTLYFRHPTWHAFMAKTLHWLTEPQ